MDTLDQKRFHEDGFVVIKQFVPASTARTLKTIAVSDQTLASNADNRLDATGRQSKVTLWYEPRGDALGRLACSDRMIGDMSDCLGARAMFFHAKVMQKEARSGGAWEWHQDYGYWYDDGFLTDGMASAYVALDPATRENGCLMVMPGTHKYGRLRHGKVGDQTGADMARVDVLQKRHDVVYVELEAGDAVFFHSSLLHASNPNLSDQPRWGMISCFFRADNESTLDDPRFRVKEITPTPHSEILAHGADRVLGQDRNARLQGFCLANTGGARRSPPSAKA